MISGQIYQPWDDVLTRDREMAKDLCFQLNQTLPSDRQTRASIVSNLLDLEGTAWIESPFNCDYGYNIKAGNGFYANHGCTILDAAPVTFGSDCLLAPGVVISTATHPINPQKRAAGEEYALAITVGDNVWFGANVTVCPGVTIGDNVVIGAGSVVVRDLPSNTVCVGSPAKPIRSIDEEHP
ncbi:sugar O-acetyltransferase [Parasalinivibrio latis]|uniref:sugar O-acetyltransferase n=1 Tax=Parasalinivibrio latis TaxID=2952610 RepID=UPI003DA323F5